MIDDGDNGSLYIVVTNVTGQELLPDVPPFKLIQLILKTENAFCRDCDEL